MWLWFLLPKQERPMCLAAAAWQLCSVGAHPGERPMCLAADAWQLCRRTGSVGAHPALPCLLILHC